MTEIKRYGQDIEYDMSSIIERKDGPYVLYSDLTALQAKHEERDEELSGELLATMEELEDVKAKAEHEILNLKQEIDCLTLTVEELELERDRRDEVWRNKYSMVQNDLAKAWQERDRLREEPVHLGFFYNDEDGITNIYILDQDGNEIEREVRAKCLLERISKYFDRAKSAESESAKLKAELERMRAEIDIASVAGIYMDRSLADFRKACEVLIIDEEKNIHPNNALISVLCDAIRLTREFTHCTIPRLTPANDQKEEGYE
ncbi:MAG: hypothetical protein ACE14T_11175 [Syntrophales bacterium]